MATLSKTFTFATNAEGFVGTAVSSSHALTWVNNIGNPAGSLQARVAGRNISLGTSYWEWTGTWADLGVPASATVTAVALAGASTRATTMNVARAGVTIGPYDVRDSSGNVLGTLWGGRTPSGQEAGWVSTGAQPAVPIPSHSVSDSIRIRLADTLGTGNNNSAQVVTHDDQVALTITYTLPNPPANPPTNLSVSNLGTTSLTLTWTSPEGAGAHRVYRDGVLVADTAGTTFYDTGRTPGASHSYRVSGYNAAGEGPLSTALPVTMLTTVPGPVRNIVITDVTPPPTDPPAEGVFIGFGIPL